MEVLHHSGDKTYEDLSNECENDAAISNVEFSVSNENHPSEPESLVEVKMENTSEENGVYSVRRENFNLETATKECKEGGKLNCEMDPQSVYTEGSIKIKTEFENKETVEVVIDSQESLDTLNSSLNRRDFGLEHCNLSQSDAITGNKTPEDFALVWQNAGHNEDSESNLIVPDGEPLKPEENLFLSTDIGTSAATTVRLSSGSPAPRTPRKRFRPRKFKCDKCDSAFKSGYDLRIHSTVHTGEKPYSCEICGRAFARPGLVNNHMHVHTGVRKFSCDTCGRAFTTSSFLTVHKRVHTGERPFQCDLCGQKFSASCTLIAHKRRHSEAKPFVCDICGKAFKVSNDLHAHKQTHSGEKPYFCELCGKVFGRNSHLTAHMIVHKGGKPHVCSLCQVSFARPYNLTIHMQRQHPGEKTFVCDICADAFINARELSNHRRTHTDTPQKLEEEVVTSILA